MAKAIYLGSKEESGAEYVNDGTMVFFPRRSTKPSPEASKNREMKEQLGREMKAGFLHQSRNQ